MFPDEKWAPSVGSFELPIEPPTTDPGAAPTISIPVNCSWLPYIRGALFQLTLQATWKADPALLLLTQQRAMTLISNFTECSSGGIPFSCPYPFAAPADGWTTRPYGAPYTNDHIGLWIPGSGWNNTFTYYPPANETLGGVDIHLVYASAVKLDTITCQGSLTKGQFDGNEIMWQLYCLNGASLVAALQIHRDDMPNGNFDRSLSFPVQNVTEVVVEIFSCHNTAGVSNGLVNVDNVTVYGQGTPPPGC